MSHPGFGPGIQLSDEVGVTMFASPNLTEREGAGRLKAGIAVLEKIYTALRDHGPGASATVDLAGLDATNLDFVSHVLGEGEVSVVASAHYQAQEAVLAGVWRIRETDENGALVADTVEIGAFPQAIAAAAFARARDAVVMPEELGPNVFNAPPLVTEINEQLAHRGAKNGVGLKPHVINLTLLPHTEEDLTFLDMVLGRGGLTILSRGYGNCRITATATRDIWWVQYYNAQGAMTLNSIEVMGETGSVPEVACAAPEDIADSAERLHAILETYR